MPRTAQTAPEVEDHELDSLDSFLSDEQVEDVAKDAAADNRYVKLSKLPENKVHRFRFFGKGITGYEGWVTSDKGDKPLRWRTKPTTLPANLREQNGKREAKRFVAGLVWDYESSSFKILQFTQKTVLEAFSALLADKEDHGDPRNYDIKIKREGSGKESKYMLTGGQYKDPPQEAVEAYADLYCDLEKLFDGLDPWNPESKPVDEDDDDD